MVKFALACEGITDQIAIENILCGFYKDYDDLDEEIEPLQPPYDATTQKQKDGEFGGWEMLLEYLSEKRFRDDVVNSEYLIIQIDSDISKHKNFSVSHTDSANNELSIADLIENISKRLIEQINSKQNFYQKHEDKIIFAISVHELECWILPHYKTYKNEKIKGCGEALERAYKKKILKAYNTYDDLTKPFIKNKNLSKIISKSTSLEIFINNLPKEIGS
jgi:hypothetical protein